MKGAKLMILDRGAQCCYFVVQASNAHSGRGKLWEWEDVFEEAGDYGSTAIVR